MNVSLITVRSTEICSLQLKRHHDSFFYCYYWSMSLKEAFAIADCVVSAIQFLLMYESMNLKSKSGILLNVDGLKFSLWSSSNLKHTQ